VLLFFLKNKKMGSTLDTRSFSKDFFERAARRARIIGPLLNYPRTRLYLVGAGPNFGVDDAKEINESMGVDPEKIDLKELDQIVMFDARTDQCAILRILHNKKMTDDNRYQGEFLTLSATPASLDWDRELAIFQDVDVEVEEGLILEETENINNRDVPVGIFQVLERAFRTDSVELEALEDNLVTIETIENELREEGLSWRQEDLQGNKPAQAERAPVPMDVESFKALIGAWREFEKFSLAETILPSSGKNDDEQHSSFLEIFCVSDSDSEDSSSVSF
jgi:hypothetical protein